MDDVQARYGIPINLALSLVIALSAIPLATVAVQAVRQNDTGRTQIIVEQVTEHSWWMVRWQDNRIDCEIEILHGGLPSRQEIYHSCGGSLFDKWKDTPPCPEAASGEDTSDCMGYYLFFAGSQPAEREMVVHLPKPSAWLSLHECRPQGMTYLCGGTPHLVLQAEEPVPDERITSIHALIGDDHFYCALDKCRLPLPQTTAEGIEIEFWTTSSLGDQSDRFSALIRVTRSGPESTSLEPSWQVDVLSDQWRGEHLTACAASWEVFPPVGDLPSWLSTPEDHSGLASDQRLDLLAGRLVRWGFIAAPDCPANGFLPDGSLSACGIEQTRDAVNAWQDRFDGRIYQFGTETGLPAPLLKRLFAQESQFWPGDFPDIREYGLGGLHLEGGDALLLWNVAFYEQFCPTVLSEITCQGSYYELSDANQALLKGALSIQANVSCESCAGGIDLDKAELSVDLFGQLLLANCDQVGSLMRSITDKPPGQVSDLEDLWRFTLVNYNAGPGCLSQALGDVWTVRRPLDWAHVSERLSAYEACKAAVSYVDEITQSR